MTAPAMTGSMMLPDEIPPIEISRGIIIGSRISIAEAIVPIVLEQ